MRIFFTTSTIKDWYPLFDREKYRNIAIDSLRFLINENRVKLHGYVIMPNHLHVIFTVLNPFLLFEIFRDFHKYTSQQILKILKNERKMLLSRFKSEYTDRHYQIWQTTHAPKEIVSYCFFRQKLDYIHNNPCRERWNLCQKPEDYPYSSAMDYIVGNQGLLHVEKILE